MFAHNAMTTTSSAMILENTHSEKISFSAAGVDRKTETGHRRKENMMAEYITREAAIAYIREQSEECQKAFEELGGESGIYADAYNDLAEDFYSIPAADVAPVRHGRWLLQANNERTNYRWNVTAECSECCDEEKEIWAGFFPNVPDWLARDVALESAKSVKLSNYCPNCGAKMDG